MKILIICSKRFYDKINDIKKHLEDKGHFVMLPNCYDKPNTEKEMWDNGNHSSFKKEMYRKSESTIKDVDAVLVLNFDKDNYKNYIGGATFLEMYDAFRYSKKIYLYNDIPSGILYDEIDGFEPWIIHGDLSLIKETKN